MMQDHDQETTKTDQDEEALCPLFMDSLPPNFASNPQLAAIASLLNSDESDGHDDEETAKEQRAVARIADHMDETRRLESAKGGGKVRALKSRSRRAGKPYPSLNQKKQTEEKASLGEAQLFMKLWKL